MNLKLSRERRAVLHVHSTHSDGEFTLPELRTVFLAAGCEIVCMADHADDLTPAGVAEYVAECAALSDERLRFIPGLEFGCERRMHVLGYGVTALAGITDPEGVFRHIAASGGVSVIAHPKTEHFPWIESFAELPQGIEAWNSKYDGRYGPRAVTFALIARLQARRDDLRAFYGQDLHWKRQYRQLFVSLQSPSTERADVLTALRQGAFEGHKEGLVLPSNGRLEPKLLALLDARNRRSSRAWALLKRVKAMSGRVGDALPGPIKAQLRRIF